ncbi:unnamed protein product [Prunus armeniaca]
MLGGKTLPYLVLHGGGSRRKSLCLRKHLPKIAYNTAMHSPEIASHKLRLLSEPQDKPSIGNRNVTSLRSLADTCHPCTGEPNRPHLPTCAYTSNVSTFPFFSFLRQSTPFPAYGRHAWVEFSLTSRAERQARTGRVFTQLSCRTAGTHGRVFTHLSCRMAGTHGLVFTHLSCRTAGTHGSSFHSPLVSNGRHARVEFSLTSHAYRVKFSLTSRAERQARMGRVFTHLSRRTAGTHGSNFHSHLVPNGRHAWSSFHSPIVSNGRHAWVAFFFPS